MRPLTASEIAHFQSEGYVIVPDFFATKEVSALVAELGRLQEAGLLRNVSTDGDGKTKSAKVANLQICPIESKSRLISALPWRPGVPEAVTALLGGDAVQHLDQIFLKPARHGAGTGWHTDNAYFRSADPRHGLGMWCAIHEATVANGTMRFIPRSHLRTWDHVRDPGSDHHITCAHVIDETQAVPVEVPAGGVAFFNYGTAHCTKANATDRDRAGLALHFFRGDHPPGKQQAFAGRTLADWRWISGPHCDGGRGWYGDDLRGVWAREVDQLAGSALETAGARTR